MSVVGCRMNSVDLLTLSRDEASDPLFDVHRGHAPDPGRGLRLSSHPRIYHETNEVLKALVEKPRPPRASPVRTWC